MQRRSKLRTGRTGSGKTQSLVKEIKEDARPPTRSTVILDPQSGEQSLARSILPVLIGAGLWHRVIFESLASTDRVLAWQMLVPSDDPDPIRREKENEDRVHAFVALLCRRKDVKGTHSLPLIEEWLTSAVSMLIWQVEPVPLSWLPFCFLPDAPEFRRMLDCHRTDSEKAYLNRLKWEQEAMLFRRSPRSFKDDTAAAKRLIDSVFKVPFLLRIGNWKLEDALREGKIIIVEGDPDNEDVTRTLLGSLSMRIIQNAKDERSPEVDVYYEEANNFGGIIGNYEAHALSTKRQCNWRAIISVQHFNFPSEEVLTAVLNNCKDQVYFALGDPKTAEYAALVLGVPSVDFAKVLRTTTRQVRIGEEEAALDGRTVLRPVYGTESIDHLMPSRDQILKVQQDLMQLNPGWRIRNLDGRVTKPYYDSMEEKRWAGSVRTVHGQRLMRRREAEEIERRIQTLREQPPFIVPQPLRARVARQERPRSPAAPPPVAPPSPRGSTPAPPPIPTTLRAASGMRGS